MRGKGRKVAAERLLIYLQRLTCEERRRPLQQAGVSEETLDSDSWVSAGCVHGPGLWSISIPGIRPP